MSSDDFSAHLASLLSSDKGAGFRPEIFQRLVMIFTDDSLAAEWIRVKAVLKSQNVLQDYLKPLKAKAHQLKGVTQLRNTELRGDRTVKDAWGQDTPVSSEAVPPEGWVFDNLKTAIYRLEQKIVEGQSTTRKIPVSYDPVVITKSMQQTETGVIYVELAWKTESKWHNYVFERDQVFNSRKIVECAKYGAPVGSDNAAEMVQYLRSYETENRPCIAVGFAQSRMGWLGDDDELGHHGFLVGDRQIGKNGKQVDYLGEAASEFKAGGTLEGWKAAVARLHEFPSMRVAICASLCAPLLGIVSAPNPIIEFVAETSTGKSECLKVATSCWRSVKPKLPRWNSTANGIETRAKTMNDLPLIVDDTADIPESKRRDLLGQSVYMLESGHTRTRATKTLGQAPAQQWRTAVLSTGEYSLTDYVGTGGAAARVLSFWGPPLGASSEKTGTLMREVIGDLMDHYGVAGPRFVEWLCENRERWDEIAKQYRGLVSKLRSIMTTGVAMRLAETIALLELTSRLVNEALELGWSSSLIADPYVTRALERAVSEAQVTSNKAREAWEHVVSFAESRRSQWAVWGDTPGPKDEPHGGWLGWKRLGDPGEAPVQNEMSEPSRDPNEPRMTQIPLEGDLLAWHPSHLKRVLQDAGYIPEVVMKSWRDHGVLVSDKDRLTAVARCSGGRKSHRVHLIKANKTKWDPGL
jgi:hypothetical protein